MKWDRDKGIWSMGREKLMLRGTTPRNADVWTLDILIGKYELWIGTGKHAYMTFFSGPEEKWSLDREPKNCDCYGCSVSGLRISPEVAQAMMKAMQDAPHIHSSQESLDLCDEHDKCRGALPPRRES